MILALIISLLMLAFMFLGREMITWHPAANHAKSMSQLVNLPRQPGERLSVWEKRINAALEELGKASDQFLQAAHREGTMKRQGLCCVVWSLPSNHPAAVRYARAKGQIR